MPPGARRRCDVDVRRELYSGVVLAGGTAMFASLRDRLERELTEIAPNMAKVKVSRGRGCFCGWVYVGMWVGGWVGGPLLWYQG